MRLRAGSLILAALPIALLFLLPARAGAQGPVRSLKEKIRSGRWLFDARGCSSCHAVMGVGGGGGPDLARATVWASPILGAAVMWNHVPLMAKASQERGLPWPDFQAEEVGDIFTYLHSLRREKGAAYAFPAEAREGEARFAATCQRCHGRPFGGGGLGPDLGPKAAGMHSEIAFATRMLRHAPYMVPVAQRRGIPWPQLSGSEMASIFAYLRSLRPGGP